MDEMTKAQIVNDRITLLTTGGIEKDIAEKKVTLYATLNDEQWKDLASELIEAKKKCDSKPEDKKVEDKEDETEADEKTLEEIKPETDVDLSVGSENDTEVETVRQELSKAFAARLNIDVNEKTEE
jgi:vacuolar-type H+-ATPase subunit I/STV1